jgi:hypothetical protein
MLNAATGGEQRAGGDNSFGDFLHPSSSSREGEKSSIHTYPSKDGTYME